MKRTIVNTLALVLSLSLFMGCGPSSASDETDVYVSENASIEETVSVEIPVATSKPLSADSTSTENALSNDVVLITAPGVGNYDDIFNHEIILDNGKTDVSLVIDGYEFKLNSSCYCQFFENIGPTIIIGDELQYKFKVQDKSYEEYKASDITAKAISAGANITVEPTTVNENSQEYIYFSYTLRGDRGIGVCIPGPDLSRSIGIQIAITDNSVKDADAITAALLVAKTATITTKENTTKEEIDKQYNQSGFSTGTRVDNATISFESASLSFAVPEGYRQTWDNKDDSSAMQFYNSADTSVSISLRGPIKTPDPLVQLETTVQWSTAYKYVGDLKSADTQYGTLAYTTYFNEEFKTYNVVGNLIINKEYLLNFEAESETRKLTLNDIMSFLENSSQQEADSFTLGPSTVVSYDQLYQGKVDNTTRAKELIAQYGDMQRAKYDNPEVVKIEESLQDKYDISAVNLGELDIETAKDIEKAVDYMFTTYPIIKGSLNTISLANFEGKEISYIALTQTKDFIMVDEFTERPRVVKNEIVLNAGKWLNREGMLTMCKENVESGYWFKNANDPSKIIVHELGHQLLNVLRAKEYGFYETAGGTTTYLPCVLTEANKQAYIDYYWSGTAMNQELETALMKRAYSAWTSMGHIGSDEDFRASISDYAKGIKYDNGVSYHETFAEAIADIYCNGDNASDASKCIMNEINEMLK